MKPWNGTRFDAAILVLDLTALMHPTIYIDGAQGTEVLVFTGSCHCLVGFFNM
jgi:hypothetical protein